MNSDNKSSAEDAILQNNNQVSSHASPRLNENGECSEVVQKTMKIEEVQEMSSESDLIDGLQLDHIDDNFIDLGVEQENPFPNDQEIPGSDKSDEGGVTEVQSAVALTADEIFDGKEGLDDDTNLEKSSTNDDNAEEEVDSCIEDDNGNDLDYIMSNEQKNDTKALPLIKVLFTSANERGFNNIQDAVLSNPVSLFEKGRFFWSSGLYVRKMLVLYDEPHYLLVIARRPKNAAEVRGMLETLDDSSMECCALNDNDLVSNYCVAENLIDLKICKLRLSPLTTITSMFVQDKSQGEASIHGSLAYQTKSCFQVITPKEILCMSFENDGLLNSTDSDCNIKDSKAVYEITKCWENEISRAIIEAHDCSTHKVNDGDTAWRHQLILGTLHSHVVSGNYDLLEKVFATKQSPDSPHDYINERDDAGLTALHYACLRRSHKAVNILLAAGADCSIPTINGKKSPCHLCCEQLDAESLSIILSSSKPKRADPNALDEFQQTPMYVALTRGKSPIDGRNPMKCLRTLEAWGGQIMFHNSDDQSEKHPIYLLSSKWDSEGLKVAFQFFQFRFPIVGEPSDGYGRSLGAIYCYPIHVVLISLRMKVHKIRARDKSESFCRNDEDGLKRSLEALLDFGFEPNERLDADNAQPAILDEIAGCTPIQILVAIAVDILNTKIGENQNGDMTTACECVRSAATILVSNGARVWIDPPLEQRPHRERTATKQDESVHIDTFRKLNSSEYNLETQKRAIDILGGTDHLAALRVEWEQSKFVKGCKQNFLKGKGFSQLISDCACAGGSDQKSCAICWKSFGKIRNRKHVCRASRRYVCEDCSNNFVLFDGDKRRVSDGQFNLAKLDVEKSKEDDRLEEIRRRKERKMRIEKAQAMRLNNSLQVNNSLQDTKPNERQMKDDLFGNVGKTVRNFFYDEEDTQSKQRSTVDAARTLESLNQTRNAFLERGEKLNNLCEKTDALKNASKDFAKMAQQLADSQEKSIFGW
mmetsp:Transcript_3750/g.7170  ORF Transcript_3750/g.7170 Transcript_3750/m.7170 type:complete len:988 (-) Transcript_3750:684-3647(-)